MQYFILLLVLAFFIQVKCDPTIKAYDRVILHAKDVLNPTNNIGNVLDPLQTRMKTFGGGLYTQAQANQVTDNTTSFISQRFGLNFSAGFYNSAIGSYSLSVGTLYPYATGDDYQYRLIFDSDYEKVGKENDWIIFDVGYLAIMNSTGVFPGGVMFNTSFVPGDIIGFTYYNYLDTSKKDKWTTPGCKCREIIATQTEQPSKQIINSQGLTEQFIKGITFDQNGRRGFNSNQVTSTRQMDGTIIQSTRNFMTFPQIIRYLPPQ